MEIGAKVAVSSALAMWCADALGLQDPYWAGVSAVVASAGTIGASLGAAVQRTLATLIALAIGLGFAALPWNGELVSGAAVGVTFLVMMTLRLDAGARLAAASTLIVTAIPGADPVDLAIERGLNVPFGCLVALAVGLVLFPHRATTQLRRDMDAEITKAATLAASSLRWYVGDRTSADPLDACRSLRASAAANRSVLKDAAREPGSQGARLDELNARASTMDAMVDDVAAIVDLVRTETPDSAPELVAADLRAVTDALERVGRGEHDHAAVVVALAALDDTFSSVRARLGTVSYATDELSRLLAVVQRLHHMSELLGTWTPTGAPASTAA